MTRFVKLVCAVLIAAPVLATTGCGDSKDSGPKPHVKSDDPGSTEGGGKARPRGGAAGKGAAPRLDE